MVYISLFFRFFTENRGWTLPALFSILRDLRDLAYDVAFLLLYSSKRVLTQCQADFHAKYQGQRSDCMEEAARIIAKAFGNCMTDRCEVTLFQNGTLHAKFSNVTRTSPPDQSRKWGVYYVVGLVLKCYFRVGSSFCITFCDAIPPIFRSSGYHYQKMFSVPWRQITTSPRSLPTLDHTKYAHLITDHVRRSSVHVRSRIDIIWAC